MLLGWAHQSFIEIPRALSIRVKSRTDATSQIVPVLEQRKIIHDFSLTCAGSRNKAAHTCGQHLRVELHSDTQACFVALESRRKHPSIAWQLCHPALGKQQTPSLSPLKQAFPASGRRATHAFALREQQRVKGEAAHTTTSLPPQSKPLAILYSPVQQPESMLRVPL